MRILARSAPLWVVLGAALAGCTGDSESNAPIDPSLSQVTLRVEGMS